MIFLAPLHGYTDYVFRNAYTHHFGGIDKAVTPFVSLVKGKKVKLTHLADLLPEKNRSVPTIPQVIGNDAEQFIVMANKLYELGYKSINWNLGCPVRTIARKKRGSGLLPHPEMIEDILGKILPVIKQHISVKIRMGYSNENEIDRIIPVLNHFPLEYVMIHPRIGFQMYEGALKLDKLKACYDKINAPVVFSGDINTVEDYRKIIHNFPEIKHHMIGRGLLQNLFLANKISKSAKKCQENKRKILSHFIHELTQGLEQRMARERNVLNKSKEYWFSFKEMFLNSESVFNRIKTINDLSEFKNKIDEILNYEKLKEDPMDEV